MTDAIDAIRARLAAATSGLTPSPTRVNWAGHPGWFLPDALIAHLLAELDHADQLVGQQADRIDQLETAGHHGPRPDSPTQLALAGWQQATGHAAPAITP